MNQILRQSTVDFTVLNRRGTPRGAVPPPFAPLYSFLLVSPHLSRQSIRTTRRRASACAGTADGLPPPLLLSSEYFAKFLDGLDLTQVRG